MALFRRAPTEVKALLASDERPLAWSPTSPDGWAVASPGRFVCTALELDHSWVRILGASWDQPVLELTLWTPDGPVVRRMSVIDGEVLPQVVRERIMASLIVQRHVPIRADKGVRLLARRDPGTDAVTWQKVLDPGLDGADPGVQADIERALALLRDSYGV